MGFFDKITGNDEDKSEENVEVKSSLDGYLDITFNGEEFFCQSAESPNREYTVAYQDGRETEEGLKHGRVFLFEEDALKFTEEIVRPNECAVSNEGIVSVVDWLDWGKELSGKLHIFDNEGNLVLTREFDSNLSPTAITPDGKYVAVSTLNPDCSTYIFDTGKEELVVEHENRRGNKLELGFKQEGDKWILLLFDEKDSDPLYGINLHGEIVWKSKNFD